MDRQKIKGKGMQTEIQDLSSVKKKIVVTLEPEAVQQKLNSAYGLLRSQVAIRGFRKGKAPLNIIKKRYKADVEQDVMGQLVNSSLQEVMEENRLVPISYPVLNEKNLADNGSFDFSVTVEVKPQISIDNYKGLEIESDAKEPGDEEIENVLKRYQDQQAVLKDKDADQPTAGDQVSLSIEVSVDGEVYKEACLQEQIMPYGDSYLLPELEEAVGKMKKGDTADVAVTFSKEHADKKLAGKQTNFKVTLHTIKEKALPEIDDALAKSTGQAETLEQLKKQILDNLKQETEAIEKRHIEDKALEQLLNSNPFEVPASLVEHQQKHLLHEWSHLGPQPEKDEDKQKLRDQAYDRALNDVRSELILEAIAEAENIEISDEVLENKIAEMLATAGDRAESMQKYFDSHEGRHNLKHQLRKRAAIDTIVEQAKVTKVKPKPAKSKK